MFFFPVMMLSDCEAQNARGCVHKVSVLEMESQDEDVVRGVERKQMQVNGTEVASSSFEV